jgi:hypothetical protein
MGEVPADLMMKINLSRSCNDLQDYLLAANTVEGWSIAAGVEV